jgi:hypothetical protein
VRSGKITALSSGGLCMKRARAFGFAVGAAILALGGCGEDSEPGCTGASCGGAGAGAVGGASGQGGSGGASGASGAGGMGGTAGDGGMGGMEPPIMGPAPTSCVPTGPLASTLGASKTVLYSGTELLEGLAMRRTDLFATDATGILRLTEGATALARVTTASVAEVLAADLRLYWADAGSLYRVDFDADAEAPELVASGLQSPATLLQHDEENVFYAHETTASIWKQPLDGSAGLQLLSSDAADLSVAGETLYVASGQAVLRVATGGNSQAMNVLSDAPRTITDIETNGVELVWTDGVEVFGTTTEEGAMDKALTQAGPSATGVGQSRIALLRLHGNAVYFADNAGNIGKALLNGSLCELIAAGAGDVRGLAIDDDYVYLNVRADGGSQLVRIEL